MKVGLGGVETTSIVDTVTHCLCNRAGARKLLSHAGFLEAAPVLDLPHVHIRSLQQVQQTVQYLQPLGEALADAQAGFYVLAA